jgi:hypothetical protein
MGNVKSLSQLVKLDTRHYDGSDLSLPNIYDVSTGTFLSHLWNEYFDGSSGSEVAKLEKTLSDIALELERARSEQERLLDYVKLLFPTAPAQNDADLAARAVLLQFPTSFYEDFESKFVSITITDPLLLKLLCEEHSALPAELAAILYRLRRGLKALKRALRSRQRAVFCGINWCKRAWFLLHGSHPPKLEVIVHLEFSWGCAQA